MISVRPSRIGRNYGQKRTTQEQTTNHLLSNPIKSVQDLLTDSG